MTNEKKKRSEAKKNHLLVRELFLIKTNNEKISLSL